jgi:hypothetical protein
MNGDKEAIARILTTAQAPQTQSPFMLNTQLEQQAAPMSPPLNPLVQALMQRLGLLNMIRNRRNVNIVDPETPAS